MPSYFGFCWKHPFALPSEFCQKFEGVAMQPRVRAWSSAPHIRIQIRFYKKAEGKLLIQDNLPIFANHGKLFNAKKSGDWNSFIIRYAENNSRLELKFKIS